MKIRCCGCHKVSAELTLMGMLLLCEECYTDILEWQLENEVFGQEGDFDV